MLTDIYTRTKRAWIDSPEAAKTFNMAAAISCGISLSHQL